MIYVEALDELKYGVEGKTVFLAGGTTDWRREVRYLLRDTDLILLDPICDSPLRERMMWEHSHLKMADVILFWFPRETPCSITLYELGIWSASDKPIFIGMHPDYQYRQNVEIQTHLVRPEVRICYSLDDLIQQVKGYKRADGGM